MPNAVTGRNADSSDAYAVANAERRTDTDKDADADADTRGNTDAESDGIACDDDAVLIGDLRGR
jgi:hypothetical protein